MNITAYPLPSHRPRKHRHILFMFSYGQKNCGHEKLYHDIVSEAAHSHMTEQALCLISPDSCSPNKRGDLHECGCHMLDSNTTHGNAARVRYRDNILAIARQLVEQDPHEPFKIGFFASGGS